MADILPTVRQLTETVKVLYNPTSPKELQISIEASV